MSTAKSKVQEFEYKAEMKQLLNLIIHSLYTNHEIFLRELVSNASDALNKVRFKRLTDSNILDPDADLKISIHIDKENGILSIEDSGTGMTKEDLIEEIGTVASSGTLEFLKNIKEQKKELDGSMIGQFGVGFYSVFMVTDEITIETRYSSPDSTAYRWQSQGQDKFTIEECDRQARGTKIYFKLKEDFKEFLEEWKIKDVLKKYSNFVDFPVYVNDAEVNQVSALWHKSKDDIKEEELNEFYKFISTDYQAPLGHIQLNIEGKINFKALLFIPQTAPPNLFQRLEDNSLQLYSSKVFIQDNNKELLPDYLGFVKGVVDTEDLPLNVSREVVQSSPVITKIRQVVTGKILGLLEDWAKDDKEKFTQFYNNFSSLFKTGITSDFTNKDRIIELLRYESSTQEKGSLVSLKDYVSRMPEGQNEIYYISGDHRDIIMHNPNLEYFNKRKLEVLLLTDPVDIFTFPYIMEYDKKQIKNIEKDDISLDKDEETAKEALKEDSAKDIISKFKEVLGEKVEDVVISKRLVNSAVTLVTGKSGLDPQMEKMMKIMDKDFTTGKKILEVNTSHKLIKNLWAINSGDSSNELLEKCILQLFEGASLQEGYLKSASDFVNRMTEIMAKATDFTNKQ